MQGYKFINIKTQKAFIKQLMYYYLTDTFLISPNMFVKPLLNIFTKDNNLENSRELFLQFLEEDSTLFNNFLEQIQATANTISKRQNFNPIIKYMRLTCILDKDMLFNFEEASEKYIIELGNSRIKDVFFYVFFDFLNKIKDVYNFGTDVENLFKKSSQYSAIDGSSIQSLINNSLYIETFADNKKNAFISFCDGTKLSFDNKVILNSSKVYENNDEKSLLFGGCDSVSKLDYGIIPEYAKNLTENQQDNILSESVKNFVASEGLEGAIGQYYYKIKETIPVELVCGANAKKNPIIISKIKYSDSDKSQRKAVEVFCVQEYFDWKKNDSYKDLDQFIFYRKPGTLNIIENTIDGSPDVFDENEYIGIKFLKKDEIINIKNKLLKGTNQNGFLAFIPVKKVNEEFINSFNSSEFISSQFNTKQRITVFTPDERKYKLSYMEVSRLLTTGYNAKVYPINYNYIILENAKILKYGNYLSANSLINTDNSYNDVISFYRTFSSLNYDSTNKIVKTNFDINDLFDLYFRIDIHSYEEKNEIKTYNENIQETNLDYNNLLTKENLISDTQSMIEKQGKFLLLTPVLQGNFDDDLNTYSNYKINNFNRKRGLNFRIGQVFNWEYGQGEKTVLKKTDQVKTKYFILNKKFVLEIKINNNKDTVFITDQIDRFDRIFFTDKYGEGENENKIRLTQLKNLLWIKNKFSNKIYEQLKNSKFDEFMNTFFSDQGPLDINTSVIDQGSYKTSNNYSSSNNQNFKDFINYYINSVENLAAGAQDNV